MKIHILPNDKGNPPGKLADVELHFPVANPSPVFEGLKLVGFSVWERRDGGRNVTFPARTYSINGERRSFALLRPLSDVAAQDKLRDLILEAYAATEAHEDEPRTWSYPEPAPGGGASLTDLASELRTAHEQAAPLADAPFSLNAEAATVSTVQKGLF